MNIKQRLRIILYSYSVTIIVIYTIKLLCGKLSSIGKITLCICYGMIAFLLIYILLIILKNEIREKIYINKACMKFEGVFNHLIKLHKERYKLYFSGDKEKIETYSEKIEFVGKKLLELGELLISNKLTSKNNKIKLKEMMKTIRTNNLPVYVCNIETTGLDPIKDKIIQIGATKCSFDGTVLIPEDNLNVYINPEISISEFTENFTGRTNEFYASQPTLEEVMPSVRDFMGNNPVIIGWTASGFTSKFLMQAGFMTGFMVYPKMNIDLVDIARSTIPVERSGMNYKFATISNICKVPVATSADRPVSSHDAADDVFAYIDIFNKLYPSCITGNDTAKIVKSSYWEKSNFCRSIYFETDHGSVHIDANTDFFVEDTPGFFDTVDMDALSQTILTTCKAELISDVVKLYYTNWKKNQKKSEKVG